MSETPTNNTPAAEEETVETVYSPIGLRDVVVAPLTKDKEGEDPTWGTVVPLVGAIDFDVSDNSGDPDVQYYDDHEGDVLQPDPELKGTIEMADLPPRKYAMLLGHQVDDNGVVIHNADDKAPYFAWGFKSQKSDGNDRYTWYYKGRASMAQDKHTTKQGKNITRQSTKLTVTFIKLTSTKNARAFVDEDDPDFASVKSTFFDAPYTPDFGE